MLDAAFDVVVAGAVGIVVGVATGCGTTGETITSVGAAVVAAGDVVVGVVDVVVVGVVVVVVVVVVAVEVEVRVVVVGKRVVVVVVVTRHGDFTHSGRLFRYASHAVMSRSSDST